MWEKLLYPFMVVMNKSTYKQKFVYISILLAIPLIYLSLSWYNDKQLEIKQLTNEQEGLEQLSQIWPLALQIQQHRGLANGYLNGNEEAITQLHPKAEEIDLLIQRIEQEFNQEKFTDAYGHWTTFMAAWQHLSSSYTTMQAAESFQTHSELVSDLLNILNVLADESTLLLDNNISSYYMIDLLVKDLPALVEHTAVIRGLGNGVLAAQSLTADTENKLLVEKQLATITTKAIEQSLQRLAALNAAQHSLLIEQLTGMGKLSNQYLTVLNKEIIETDRLQMEPALFFSQGTSAIEEMNLLIAGLKETVEETIERRQSKLQSNLTILTILLLLATFIIICVYFSFYRNVIHAVHTLKQHAQTMADGDFSTAVELSTRDELSKVGYAFNKMQTEVSRILHHNQFTANAVMDSSISLSIAAQESTAAMGQIATSVQTVSDGTMNQKRTTNESATAISEIAIGVNRIAEAASEVAYAAIRTNEQIMFGKEQLDNSVEQMNMIKQSQQRSSSIVARLENYSSQIGKTISLVMEISAQTKLLSLNASIEAARAGEHGLGFAVVAKEVGTLAEQSAHSASEIASLLQQVTAIIAENVIAMHDMSIETDNGLNSIRHSQSTLDLVTADIKLVNDQIQDVSATSEQISAEMQQISAAISEIVLISEQSAHEAEAMAAATEEQLASTEQMHSATQSLQKMSEQLQAELNKFVLQREI